MYPDKPVSGSSHSLQTQPRTQDDDPTPGEKTSGEDIRKQLPEQPPFISKASRKSFPEGWEVGMSAEHSEKRKPANDLNTAANELHFCLAKATHIQGDQAQSAYGIPFELYPIDSDKNVYVSGVPAPDQEEILFWAKVTNKSIHQIVNINYKGDGEHYYPSGNQGSLDFEGKVTIVQECPSPLRGQAQDIDQPPAIKRSRPESVEAKLDLLQPAQVRVEMLDRPMQRVEIYKVTDWKDGRGYDHQSLLKFVRRLSSDGILIHCRAGLGRSATMALACQLVNLHEKGYLPSIRAVGTLAHLILQGRDRRHDSRFVTGIDQVETLLRILQALTECTEEELVGQVNQYMEKAKKKR